MVTHYLPSKGTAWNHTPSLQGELCCCGTIPKRRKMGVGTTLVGTTNHRCLGSSKLEVGLHFPRVLGQDSYSTQSGPGRFPDGTAEGTGSGPSPPHLPAQMDHYYYYPAIRQSGDGTCFLHVNSLRSTSEAPFRLGGRAAQNAVMLLGKRLPSLTDSAMC
jgi:hypothetical protein